MCISNRGRDIFGQVGEILTSNIAGMLGEGQIPNSRGETWVAISTGAEFFADRSVAIT